MAFWRKDIIWFILILKVLFKVIIPFWKQYLCGTWEICGNTVKYILTNNICKIRHYKIRQDSINCYLKIFLRSKKNVYSIGIFIIYIWNHLQSFYRVEFSALFIISFFYGLILISWFRSCHRGYFIVQCCYWFSFLFLS